MSEVVGGGVRPIPIRAHVDGEVGEVDARRGCDLGGKGVRLLGSVAKQVAEGEGGAAEEGAARLLDQLEAHRHRPLGARRQQLQDSFVCLRVAAVEEVGAVPKVGDERTVERPRSVDADGARALRAL